MDDNIERVSVKCEAKRNQTKRNETDRNKTKRNQTKRNETDRNETKRNEIFPNRNVTKKNEKFNMAWRLREFIIYIDYPNLEEFNKETRFVRQKKEEISLHWKSNLKSEHWKAPTNETVNRVFDY